MKKAIVSLSACLAFAGILSACSSQSAAQDNSTQPSSASTQTAAQGASSQHSSASTQTVAQGASQPLSTNTQTAANASQAHEIKIDMNEFSYSVHDIKVHAGEKIHFVLTNSGKVEHDINSDELHLDKDVEPGKTELYDWTAPSKTGTYQIICDKPGHKEQGMTLKLIVE